MERIDYAGGAYITGDEIAQAVLEYATTLAGNGDVDIVHVQVRERDGVLRRVRMLLGAAMPIAVTELGPGNPEELHDDAMVEDLRRRGAVWKRSPRTLTQAEFEDLRTVDALPEF